jgi:hypothetical protein
MAVRILSHRVGVTTAPCQLSAAVPRLLRQRRTRRTPPHHIRSQRAFRSATTRHSCTRRTQAAATDALPPEFGSAAFTQRATLSFDRTTVTRFMRLGHNPRVPDGLIAARTLATRIGQPVSRVRRQQDSGRLPAAWFHKRGNGQIDLFTSPATLRGRQPFSTQSYLPNDRCVLWPVKSPSPIDGLTPPSSSRPRSLRIAASLLA